MVTLPTNDEAQIAAESLTALFEADLEHDCGDAARSILRAGRPIHYVDKTTPEGHVIREHPDGNRELLRVDADGSTHVLSTF